MKSPVVAICVISAALVMAGCRDGALANDDSHAPPTNNQAILAQSGKSARASSGAVSRPSKQHRTTQKSPKDANDQKANASKAQPWFAVDPERAASKPNGAPSTESQSSVPTEKWARDPVEFGYKVNGSNDLHMMPRFDINQNPSGSVGIGADSQGASGEVGVNVHF